ncbi:MAG: choice-of-anchor V domain-containing protein [Blastocatellia bacterium]
MQTRSKWLKLSMIAVFGLLAIGYVFKGTPVHGFAAGPPIGRTGAPALGSFPAELTCQGCHSSFVLNSGPGTLTVTGLPTSYMLGQEVTVTVTINQADRMRFGFEATVLDDLGRRAGDLTVTEAERTRIVDGTGAYVGRQYVQHIAGGIMPNGTNQNSWTFRWKAPATNVGRVTVYVASNAANGNGNNSGDYIYITNTSIQAPAASLPTVTSVSAASYLGALSAESIGAIFGNDLATATATATAQPLPTELSGTKVSVKDNAGTSRDAGLFAVSKGQVNFLAPAGTSNGMATVTVLKNNTAFAQGNVMVDTVAPALFGANQNGAGIAAAVLLRINAAGVRTFEPIASFDMAQVRFVATPIALGPDTDQLFLIFFGSGIRGNTMLSAVTCTIGGTAAEVLYAGAATGFVGLDQVNVRLPRSLAGRGNIAVALTVAMRAANAVNVNVQ